MATPDYFVFNGDPDNSISPRRPGIDDVGGAAKEDDQEFPPNPITMPTAPDENQAERLLVGYGKVVDSAKVYVKFVAGAPTIFGIRAVGENLIGSDFTPTHVATGKVKIACPSSKIVPPFFGKAYPQATGDNTAVAYITGSGEEITIETRTAGALADVDFVLEWC